MSRYKMTSKERRRYEKLRSNIKDIRKYMRGEYIKGRKVGVNKDNLPDLVLPELQRKRKEFKSYNEFLTQMGEMKKFTSIERYIATSYKKNHLKILREEIDNVSLTISNYNALPESHGRYSKVQKEDHPELAKYMEMYNKIERMSSKQFMDMYTKGYIVPFKYIYRELDKLANRGYSDEDSSPYLQQQQDMFTSYQQIMAYAGK